MSRFENHLKKNIINISGNLYISPSDSLYYEKITHYIDPDSPETHYELGQKHERLGSLSKALFHYIEAASHIDSTYYLKAKKSIKILEEKINGKNLKESIPLPLGKSRVPMITKSIIASLLLLNVFLLLFLFVL